MSFTAFEHRWISAIMPAFTAPDGEFALREGEVDYLAAADMMVAGSTPKAGIGLHAAVWIAALSPVWMLGRPQTLDEVPASLRTEILARMVSHPLFLVRGLATLLKLATTLAIMRSPVVRARTRYDERASTAASPERRALPLVA